MTIKEAEEIIAKTNSPFLKRDMQKFIKRQRAKEGLYGKTKKGDRPKQSKKMNVRALPHKETGKCVVYRYIDITDGFVKYVGIVHKGNLQKRLLDHAYRDEWTAGVLWLIEYFECNNRSEAEAFESHLIAKYKTWKYFNKAKVQWGENSFLPDVEAWWRTAREPMFADYQTMAVAIELRHLLRSGEVGAARELYALFDFCEEGG